MKVRVIVWSLASSNYDTSEPSTFRAIMRCHNGAGKTIRQTYDTSNAGPSTLKQCNKKLSFSMLVLACYCNRRIYMSVLKLRKGTKRGFLWPVSKDSKIVQLRPEMWATKFPRRLRLGHSDHVGMKPCSSCG